MPTLRSLIPVWLCFAFAGVALTEQPQQPVQPRLPGQDFSGETPRPVLAVHAVDEIEVDLDGVHVRVKLVGVAGEPDGAKKQADADTAAKGRAFLDNLLRGESVYLDQEPALQSNPSQRRTAHGIEALVYRAPDGLCINLELIRQGHARHDARRRHRYLAVFAYYAAAARQHERGLWAPQPSTPAAGATGQVSDDDANQVTSSAQLASQTDLVWIAKSGERYHTRDCYHLRGSKLTITRTEAIQRGLKPCTHCKPDQHRKPD